MKRFKGIDILRAIAVLLVAMYHFWVVSGYQTTGITILNVFLSYCGEIGVTMFFIISGFSIYCSLYSQEKKENILSFTLFIKKRLKRILPQYIGCLLIIILVGDGAIYISTGNMKSIITHLLFIHNYFISTHGSISGVLWTMGVIFQFYLIAIILYKYLNKQNIVVLCFSIVLSIFSKYLFYYIFSKNGLDSSYYFIYGRQLFSSLDNFVIGMWVARDILINERKVKILPLGISIFLFFIWIIYITPYGMVYSNTIFGYTWHSITAILIGICIWQIVQINIKKVYLLEKILLFIGKYEYGIYIWHLLIANNLYGKSDLIQKMAVGGYWKFAILMMLISIGVGWISSIIFDGYKKMEV